MLQPRDCAGRPAAAEPLGELLRQDARDDVVWTAWRIGHDQLDRLGGISLRNGGAILRGDAKQGQHYCCNPNDGHCDLPVPALWRLTRTATRSSGCRAAKQRDELAPFHCAIPPVRSTQRIAHVSYGGRLLRCGSQVESDAQAWAIVRKVIE